jgi:hypothetical protein
MMIVIYHVPRWHSGTTEAEVPGLKRIKLGDTQQGDRAATELRRRGPPAPQRRADPRASAPGSPNNVLTTQELGVQT